MKLKSTVALLFAVCLIILLAVAGTEVKAQSPELAEQLVPSQPVVNPQSPPTPPDISPAATSVYYPSDDTTVQEGASNAPAPNQAYLGVGYYNSSSIWANGRIRSYLRFDLSTLPANANITSATVRLYHAGGADYPGQTRSTTFYRVTGNWNEASLTWNNRPGYAESIGSVATTYSYQGWVSLDLTNLVRTWANGSQANYGLIAIGPESTAGIYRAFFSSEVANGPELQISYQPALPPVLDVWPGTLALRAGKTGLPFTSSFYVGNVTSNSLNWSATRVGSAAWLGLSTTSGSATPTLPGNLILTINPAGLAPGIYTEQIRVSSSTVGVIGSPMTATVQLEVVDQLSNTYLPLILRSGSGSSTSPNVVALVLGIADYQYAAPPATGEDLPDYWGSGDLSEPGHDMADFTLLLEQEFSIPPAKILTNLDSTVSPRQPNIGLATKAAVLNAMALLDQMEDKETIVIIYYSGHGGQVLDASGDESDGRDEFIAMYNTNLVADQYVNILTDDELEALLATLESDCIIVILDSCYGGGMMSTATVASEELRPRGLINPALPPLAELSTDDLGMAELAAPGRLIITGGTGDQSTWESPTLGNGVFTYFFLAGLRDILNDANQNNRVSLEEAFWFTRNLVDEWIYNRQGEHQNPDINDRCFGQVDPKWGC